MGKPKDLGKAKANPKQIGSKVPLPGPPKKSKGVKKAQG